MSKSTKKASLLPSTWVLIAILFALAPLGEAATGPQIMAPTNRYINVMTHTYNTASTFNPNGPSLYWWPATYTVSFPYAKANTEYRCGASIPLIHYQITSDRYMDYYIDVYIKATTGVTMGVYAYMGNRIKILVINTLTIQQGFMTYYFHYLTPSYTGAVTFLPGESDVYTYSPLVAPVPADAQIYLAIIGLDIRTDASFNFGFKASAVLISSTDLSLNITSIGSGATLVYLARVLVFVFSNTQLATSPPVPARYTLGSFSSTAGNTANLIWSNVLTKSYNTLIGLTSFKYTGNNFFHYETKVNAGVSDVASSNNNWLQLSFSVIVFQYTYCPDTLAYLMVPTSLCYDLCPIRYASNGSNFQCDPCPTYDCYYCGFDGKCINCSATVDFRQMNNSTKRCVPLLGYYDNGVSQAVPCDATKCLTCTSATSCLTCYTGKYLSGTSCLACMTNCLNCTSGTTCVTCDTNYIFSGGACVVNCSNITLCSTCTISSGIICSTCAAGYSVVNNTCQIVCGDGQLMTPQVCDDNNTNPNDGCSPTCQVQLGYFCNTASPTVCQPCSVNCTMCSSPTLCVNCTAGYIIIAGTCAMDCTAITFCATCSYDSLLPAPGKHCDTCQTGYELQANNTCASRCGDGIRVPTEGCDDGGAAAPGCSATCTVQFAYFCTDTFPNASICTPCIAECDICADSVTCNNCSSGSFYDTTVTPPVCKADCSSIANCSICTYSSSTGALLCANCSSGYQDNGANGCAAICGDGIVQPGQLCDDGNTLSGDGCSTVCQLESNFQCVTVGQTSVCSLISMNVALVSIMKTPTANSIAVTYSVSPGTFPIFSTIDWSTVVYQQSTLPVTFSSFTFDSTTGQLLVNVDYTQPLDSQLLQVGFNFPPGAPFNMLTPTNTSSVLVADNNLALGVYSSEEYGQVDMVSYVAMGASAAAAILFLLGFLKGKLVGLQCVTVYQLTFFSLLTCQNMIPSFYGLKYLAYSCGYNLKPMQKSSVNIGRRYNPVGHFEPFLENYNVTAVVFILPLILSLVFALINRFRYKSQNEFLLKHSRLLRGEGCFYGLMFSAYEIVVSLGIEVTHMGSGMMGLAVGAVLALGIILFGVLLRKYPEFFGEFTEKFNQESCIQSGYYCFLIGQRVITGMCLVMAFFNPLGAVIAGLLAIQIVLVLAKKPYSGQRGWLRPFLNLLFSTLIQVVFIMAPMLSSMSTISHYAPLAIEGVLVVVLAYNIYYLIQQFRNPGEQKQTINQEQDQINEEMNKLNVFQRQILTGPTISMLDKTNATTSQQQLTSEPGSPSRLTGNMLNNVKDILNKVKLSSADPNNVSFAGSQDISSGVI